MRRRRHESAMGSVPNLAPMVDVIMVILVFFLLGASLVLSKEGMLQTELDPRSGPGEGAAVEIVPSVKIGLQESDGGRSCKILVNGEALGDNSFEGLKTFLVAARRAKADVHNPLVIGAQPAVQWKLVLKAMDAARTAGFKNVQFSVSLGGTDWHRQTGVPRK